MKSNNLKWAGYMVLALGLAIVGAAFVMMFALLGMVSYNGLGFSVGVSCLLTVCSMLIATALMAFAVRLMIAAEEC
jgi:hypothetical protein